jgi:hypothetical protein
MSRSSFCVDFALLVGRASGSLVDLGPALAIALSRSLMALAMTMMIALPKMETGHEEGVRSGG